MIADLIVKGKIYTGTGKNTVVEAFAVKEGRYVYVGEISGVETYMGEQTKVIEVKKGLVMPGITEGHAHTSSAVELVYGVDLNPYDTIEGYQQAITNYIELHPEQEFIIGHGYMNGVFSTNGPDKSMLDQVTTTKPIYLTSEDEHSCWVNSKALEIAGITKDTKDIEGGFIQRRADGLEPSGWCKETAMSLLSKAIPEYTIEQYKRAILYFQEMAKGYGVSSCFEPMYVLGYDDDEIRMAAYKELALEGKLHIRFYIGYCIFPTEDMQILKEEIDKAVSYRTFFSGVDKVSLTAIKVFLDGVVEGHTAFLKEAYLDDGESYGVQNWKQEYLNELCRLAEQEEFSIHAHAVGDGATECALQAYAYARDNNKSTDNRNCITHVQVVAKDQFVRFRELEIIAVTNPYWHFRNEFYYDVIEVPFLGKQRADLEYPMQSFLKEGVILTQASDWPVTADPNVFIGLEQAVTRKHFGEKDRIVHNQAECVTVGDMLQAMTLHGAYQNRAEKEYGSIEVGKIADFIEIDQDLFTIDPYDIGKTKVLKRYIDGEFFE